jgi:hypothetical protein
VNDDEEISATETWTDLHAKIKARQDLIGSEDFLKKLQSGPKVTRTELRDWLYALLAEAAEAGALTAADVDDVGDDLAELREEVERLGNLTRMIASTNFFALVQRLVQLVMERVQDPEVRGVAQVVAVLFSPAAPQPAQAPTSVTSVAAPEISEVPGGVAP